MSITTEEEESNGDEGSSASSSTGEIPKISFSPFAEPVKIKIRHVGPTYVDGRELAKLLSSQDSLVEGWNRFHRVLGTKAGSFFQLQFLITSGKKTLPEAFESLLLEWVDSMGLNATMGVLFAQLTIYEFADVSQYLQSIPEISSATYVCRGHPDIPDIRRIALDSKY